MIDEDLSAIEITNLGTFERAIREVAVFWLGRDCLWRGHAQFDWVLQPDVFRPTLETPLSENTLIRYFMTYAETRHARCPNQDDLLGWLMLARHYGLPTRLLDWSTSPLAALYFVVSDAEVSEEIDGCLWALEPGEMNSSMLGGLPRLIRPDSAEVRALARSAFDVPVAQRQPPTGQALTFGPREIDPQILAQQGQFTVHADANDLASKTYDAPGAGTPARAPWRRAFRIPHSAKAGLRFILRAMGIGPLTLFPDLHTLAQELKSGVRGHRKPGDGVMAQ